MFQERRQARLAFGIVAIAAWALILWLGLGLTFFADEWAFIEHRSLTDPATWWMPHNEHWTTLPVLVYRVLVETMGIGSYVPFLLLLTGLHVAVGIVVFRLIERSSGPLMALVGSSIILLFGSGFENLYWGFQISFIGSVLLGLAAMDLSDSAPSGKRAILIAVLLTGSMACSGIGLVMGSAVGVEWLLGRRWRRWIPVLLVPVACYATWYLEIGRTGIVTFRDPLTPEALADAPVAILHGLANAFGSIFGLPLVGFMIAAVVVTWGGRSLARGDIEPRSIGPIAGICVLYGFIGLTRAQLYDGVLDLTRYTYVSGILALVALTSLIGHVAIPSQGRPRLLGMLLIGSWLAVAITTNVGLLVAGRAIFQDRANMTRALVTEALEPDRPSGTDIARSLVLVPSPASLEAIVSRYGDPRMERLAPGSVKPIPTPVMARAKRWLAEGAPIFVPQPDGSLAVGTVVASDRH